MGASPATYDEFVRLVHTTFPNDGDIRWGQHWFNVLHNVRPDLANEIRGTVMDPFYRDYVKPITQTYVQMGWNVANSQEEIS